MSLREKFADIEDVSINLLLTRRCNYECEHCMYSAGPKMPAAYMRDEDLYAIREFLETLGKNLLPSTNFSINLVGGEPTLDMDRFKAILERIRDWRLPQNEDEEEYSTRNLQIEMTTNGWWLEKYKDTAAFGKAVRQALINEEIRIRISNSIYHDRFRARRMEHLFKHKEPSGYYNARETSPLESYFIDFYPEETCCGNDVYPGEECPECGEVYDYLGQESMCVDSLREAAKNEFLYIDSKLASEEKVSPVGRAKKNEFGIQDGACHETDDIKFTFMPTLPGERPGRIYDVCCNGGHVPMGFADEGINLFFKRMLFMQALHKKFPITKTSIGHNDGQGYRCLNCPSFGAKWVRENASKIEKTLKKETRELQPA